MGTNGKIFLINAHGVLRRMGAVAEIPGNYIYILTQSNKSMIQIQYNTEMLPGVA